ncbi:MAG: AraC family transcriptional regulator [Bacteroides sp.]|nr:AraC family transcriptional regulator [Bacteroides sp.]
MKNPLLTLIVLLTSLIASASDPMFYTISDMFGVSIREVFSVCKDKNDFIWGSGRTGMLRISENDFRRYNLPYNTTDNYFTRIAYHPELLVAYTNNGQFFTYNEVYDSFVLLADIKELLQNEFFNLNRAIIDRNKRIWIGSMDGLFKWENDRLDLILEETHVQYVALYDDSSIFVATTQGLGWMDIESNEFTHICKYKVNNEQEVSGFLYDPVTELLWVGTISSRLLCYKKEGTTYREMHVAELPEQPVLTIKKNRGTSSLLVGIDGQGLWELTEQGDSILNVYKEDVNDPYSLPGDGVYDVWIDGTERIWVATYTGGLSYMNKNQGYLQRISHQVNQPNSLINNFVNKVLEDSKGEIWFATNDGISRWNREENRWNHYLQNKQDQAKVFLALCEDDHGNIWAGTYSSGVHVLDGRTGKTLHHYFGKDEENGAFGRFISDLYKDSQGNIWIGGTRNIICYLEKEKRFRIYDQYPVYAIGELSPEKIVLACTHGLFVLDKEKGSIDRVLNNILANDIVLTGNDIWIATSGAGLIRYDRTNRTTESFTTQSGFPSNYVNSLLREEDCLWLGTENGLCRFFTADRTTYTYANNYPLSDLSFNPNSCSRLRDGNLIFGTNKGAVILNPDMMGQNSSKARIFFQDITVSGSSIRENDPLPAPMPVNKYTELALNYKQNNFILELSLRGCIIPVLNSSGKWRGSTRSGLSPPTSVLSLIPIFRGEVSASTSGCTTTISPGSWMSVC